MKKLTTIQQVAEASKIGKSLRFDLLLKINPSFLLHWGIGANLISDPNARQAAINGYAVEWTETGPEHHAAVAEGARLSGLGDSNKLMNEMMADFIVSKLKHHEIPRILDLGCGPGGSTIALLDNLPKRVRIMSFATLVDPAGTLFKARDDIKNKGFKVVAIHKSLVEDWLHITDLGTVNIVLFGASLHHMNVGFVLSELKKKLPGGALIGVAEWCHGLLKSPAHFRVLVSVLDNIIEPGILMRFDERFPMGPRRRAEILDKEPKKEIAAIMSMAGGFWPNHAIACKKAGIKPMFSPYEGHVQKDMWINAFKCFGFKLLQHESLNPDNPIHTVFLFQKP